MSNEIIKWEPKNANIPKSISIVGIYDDVDGFRIVFVDDKNDSNKFNVTFDNYIAYRNSDEGARLKSIDLFPSNSREWCLFKTVKSEFIDWITYESVGIYSEKNITHYFFVTSDDIIEVLTLEEPLIERV